MALISKALPQSEEQLCEAFRVALLADPAVFDCVVLDGRHENSRGMVAYIVPKGPIATERLSFRLKTSLGAEAKLLQEFVLISSLPIGADGKIDRSRLSSLVLPSDERLRIWEDELRGVEGIKDVAIVSRNINGRWTPAVSDECRSSRETATFHRVVWHRAVSRSYVPIGGDILLFVDREGLGSRLCSALKDYGIRPIVVKSGTKFRRIDSDQYEISPAEGGDYKLLFRALAVDGRRINNICHLWSYTQDLGDASRADQIESTHQIGLYSLVHLTEGLATEHTAGDVRLTIAATYTQRVHSKEPINPAKATTVGMLKCILQELPWVDGHHVDLEPDHADENATRLLTELTVSRGCAEICYRDGQRFEAGLSRVHYTPSATESCSIKRGGLYLVVGGLGGVGTQLARTLISQFDAKLIVTGRTRLPDSASWPKLLNKDTTLSRRIKGYLDLESAGGEFVYRSVDICHTKRMRDVISAAEMRWAQPLSGVFHLAASLGPSIDLSSYWRATEQHSVTTEGVERMAEILRPKVQGTLALFEIL